MILLFPITVFEANHFGSQICTLAYYTPAHFTCKPYILMRMTEGFKIKSEFEATGRIVRGC